MKMVNIRSCLIKSHPNSKDTIHKSFQDQSLHVAWLEGPFQPWVFCDSMIPWQKTSTLGKGKYITVIKFIKLSFWRIILGIVIEWLQLEGTSGLGLLHFFCSKQGQLKQVTQGCVQLGFEYLQGWTLHSFSGKVVNYYYQPW